MSKNLKISLLAKVLLVSICIVLCNCGGTPEEKKKEELVKKEKGLIGGLKKELAISQPEWEKVEKALRVVKNEISMKDLNKVITRLENWIAGYREEESYHKKEKRSGNGEEGPNHSEKMPEEETPKCISDFGELIGTFIMRVKEESKQEQIFKDLLEIFKNFKAQAELKK